MGISGRRFFRLVIGSACSKTVAFWGWNSRTLVWACLIPVSWYLLEKWKGYEAVVEEVSPIVTLLACLGVATIGIFIWNILRSPLLIFNYWYDKHKVAINQLKNENATLKKEIDSLNTNELKILFDSSQSSYSTDEIPNSKQFRICVHNAGMKAAEHVVVKVTRIAPSPESMGRLPIILKPKNAEPPYYALKINAGDNEFIDVVKVVYYHHWQRQRDLPVNERGSFEFCTTSAQPLIIPVVGGLGHPYEITIQVTGDGGIGDIRSFILGKKEGHHYMEMLPEKGLGLCHTENT